MFSQHTHSVGFNFSAFEKNSWACALRFAALQIWPINSYA